MQKTVSIIIPCRNEVKHIALVIESIFKNTYKEIEVVIVDGMSNDGTREELNELIKNNSKIKLIDNPLQITPVAFNLGIKNSTGEIIFIVGARHVLQTNYIETCVKILNDSPEIGCVGGKVNNVFENKESELISKALSSSFAVGAGNFRIKNEDGYVDTVGTPAYRRSIFEDIGYFDEELLRNQDDEFNFRVLKKGYKILFTVQTSIQYFVRASFSKLFKQYFQYGYWKVYVNKKHRTVTTIRQMIPFFFVAFLFLGGILSFLNCYMLIGYLCILAFYFLIALISAVAKTINPIHILAMIYAFFLLHLSYGLGYWKGFLNFILLRKNAPQVAALTR